MEISEQIAELIKEHGGVLERQAKHNIYRFPDGRVFVTSQTPSDRRATMNCLTVLRHFLGVKRLINKNPDRRTKKGVAKPLYKFEVSAKPVLDFKGKLKRALEEIHESSSR